MEQVAAVLNTIKKRAAAQAVLLTTEVGLVVDGVAEEGVDLEAIAAYAASYASASARMGEETHFGAVDSVLVIYQGKAMVVAPVDATVVVALVGTGGAQLGNMRLQVRRGIADLARSLQESAHGPVIGSSAGADERPVQHSPGPAVAVQDGNGAEAPVPHEVSLKQP